MALNVLRMKLRATTLRFQGIQLLNSRGYADPSQISDFPEHEKDLPGQVKATIPPVKSKSKPENERDSTDKPSERPQVHRAPPDSRKVYPDPHQKRPGINDAKAKAWYEQNPVQPEMPVSSNPFEDIQKRTYFKLLGMLYRTYSQKTPRHTLDDGIPGPSDPLPPPIPNDPTTVYVVEPSSPPVHDAPPEIPPSPYVPPEKMKIPVSGIPPPRDPPPATPPPEITRPDDADQKSRADQDT